MKRFVSTTSLFCMATGCVICNCGGSSDDRDAGGGGDDWTDSLVIADAYPDDPVTADAHDAMETLPDPGPVDAWSPDEHGAAEVIDPDLDSDGDGIPDVEELVHGTDPHDPASAKAWRPELTRHPRLFFTMEDVPELAARASAENGPWKTILKRIMTNADLDIPQYNDDFDVEISVWWGRIAEAAAFLGLINEDPEYTARAIEILTATYPDPSGVGSMSNYDLWEAEALLGMCTAWDYLAENPVASPGDLAQARENLLHRIDVFRWMCHEGPVSWLLMLSRNNHVMKVFGALGLCAMALNDRPEAATDISEAMTGLDFTLNHYLSSEDGGYSEGWNYLSYGATTYLPFMLAYHRWADGETLPYYGVPKLQIESPHQGLIVPIQDFAVNDRTRAVFQRTVWSVQPDGMTPNTDDANPSRLDGALLYAMFDDPAFLWHWFRPAVNHHSFGAHTATFATYDGTEPPDDPGMPLEGSAIEAGFAVFRGSWNDDASYFLLQGEHGVVRIHGEGHEHADELSFILWANGSPLVIDPGYIDWDHHDLVRYPKDHNTILVDGQGSPCSDLLQTDVGADSLLTPMQHDGAVSWVGVKTGYQEVEFTRTIVRIDGRFYAVDDVIDGGGAAHTYSLLLNGMGGGDVPDSSFEMLPDGARWSTNSAVVDVRVISVSGDAGYSHTLEEHATGHGKWAMHERLAVDSYMDSPAGFLSLLIPSDVNDVPPDSTIGRIKEGLASAYIVDCDRLYTLVSNRTGSQQSMFGRYLTHSFDPGLTVLIHEFDGEQALELLEDHHLPSS